MLEIIAENTQRNKQKFLCKHSIHQPKIARLIKDQIFTSMKCAEINQEESRRARFTLAKVEPLRSLVQLQALQNPSLKTKVSTSHTLDLLWMNLGVLALIKTSLLVAIGFGNGWCVRESNFQLSQRDTLDSPPQAYLQCQGKPFRVKRTPKTLELHLMAGHSSPNRLGSEIPTLKGKAPNFQDKAIGLYFLYTKWTFI